MDIPTQPTIALHAPAFDARTLSESILRKLIFDLGKSERGAQRRD